MLSKRLQWHVYKLVPAESISAIDIPNGEMLQGAERETHKKEKKSFRFPMILTEASRDSSLGLKAHKTTLPTAQVVASSRASHTVHL